MLNSLQKYLINHNSKELQDFKYPFMPQCIIHVSITITKHSFSDKFYWYGRVDFENGNTKGKQRFGDSDDFESLVHEMNEFIKSLEGQK